MANKAGTRRPFRGPQVLSDLIAMTIEPTLARRGFTQIELVLNWHEIVGAQVAEVCQPLQLQWRGTRAKSNSNHKNLSAVLVVKVESAFALFIQHMEQGLISRINSFFGWACVNRLMLRQGPIEVKRLEKLEEAPMDEAAKRRSQAVVGAFDDEELRRALTNLGGYVLKARVR